MSRNAYEVSARTRAQMARAQTTKNRIVLGALGVVVFGALGAKMFFARDMFFPSTTSSSATSLDSDISSDSDSVSSTPLQISK
jgi:hypothetical protein